MHPNCAQAGGISSESRQSTGSDSGSGRREHPMRGRVAGQWQVLWGPFLFWFWESCCIAACRVRAVRLVVFDATRVLLIKTAASALPPAGGLTLKV